MTGANRGQETTQQHGRTRPVLGYVLAVGASVGLGLAVALSRMAYEGGTDALSIANVRATGVVILVAFLLLVTRRPIRIAKKLIPHVIGLGLLLAYMFYGNIAAVQYIPVGMAALILFLYPPMVAIILVIGFGARFSLLKLVAVLGAFVGLAIALGVSMSGLRWEGVVLSLTAGLATACNAVWIGQWLRRVDPLVLTFHMGWIAAAALWVVSLAGGGLTPPQSTAGWLAAAGVVVFQVCCVPMYFASIRHAGPQTATMVNNLQPIISVIAAYVLYGELLSLWQGFGGLMVIGGILLMQWDEKRWQAATGA